VELDRIPGGVIFISYSILFIHSLWVHIFFFYLTSTVQGAAALPFAYRKVQARFTAGQLRQISGNWIVRHESLFGITLVDNLGIRKEGGDGRSIVYTGNEAGGYQ
jgi:hypothetical protein